MPAINSYAKTFRDWEALLAAAQNLEASPDVERHRVALEQHLTQMKQVREQQNLHTANRQAASQQLARMLKDGRELAIRLRRVATANLGPKNEMLVLFGVAPIRSRSRSRKPAATPPPASPPPPEGEGTVSGPPKPAT